MTAPRSGLVAVLFTDLVGSTELMSQLGDRAFDDLRRRHFAALSKAISAHGGEEVKNTGDGLMAVFPSAAEAVEAAVAMQQATARHARSSPLAIRVGVAVGDATFEGGDYFGTPVVEAARLVGAARPGQVLTTQIARLLAGARCTATFIDQEPLALKGLPEAVPVCEVVWEPARTSVPMPALLTDMGRIFVGRDAELERLEQLWKEVAAGERRVALLAGEPGVGKTRLAAELAARVHDEGGVVLAGRCDEDLGVPYQPFVEALRHFVDHTPTGDLVEGLGRYGGELGRLIPELAKGLFELPPPMSSDPETERYRLFDAVAGWLVAASLGQPVLLVLDDLQWAAKPTLLLFRHIVSSPEAGRALVLGTYRDSELVRHHPLVELLADLRRRDGIQRLSLVGLDPSAVAAFLEQAAGHPLDDADVALAQAIHHETEGNPFFVREVFRHLAEAGAVERLEGRWTTRLPVEELGIPESVKEVIGRRLSRLSDEANRTLRAAAVVGAEFDLPMAQAAGGLDEDTVLSSLEEATAARLVMATSDARRYRFAHALVRDTLYGELSAARRISAHRRVAEALERVHAGSLDDYLPALAHHWGRASAPAADTAKAVQYAVRAGDRALAQLAHDEAVTYYGHALELLDASALVAAPRQHYELLISLGEAQRRSGDPAHRDTLLEAARLARAHGDGDALARAALANSRGFFTSVVWEVDRGRIDTLEAALIAVGGSTMMRARLLASLTTELMYGGDFDRRDRLSGEAIELARRLGDPATLVHVLIGRFNAIATTHTLAERVRIAGEVVELAEHVGDPLLRGRAWFVRYRVMLEAGDIPETDRAIEAFSELAIELNQPALHWTAAWTGAGRDLLAGRIAQADAEAHRALEIGESGGQPDAPVFFHYQLYHVRFEQGRLDELDQSWVDIMARYPRFPAAQAMLALLHCELGRTDDARAALQPLAASGFDLSLDNAHGSAMTYCATVVSQLRDTAAAAVLRARLAPFAEQLPFPGGGVMTGAFAHHLGMLAATLGDWEEAETRFARAEATHWRIATPGWLARTRLEWARMLLTRRAPGDAGRARELLSQALATARGLGQRGLERQAVALIGDLR